MPDNRCLMKRLLDEGYPMSEMFHHESDLYVFVTPLTSFVISKWCDEKGYGMSWHCPTFKDQVTGRLMYDCAFQYVKYIELWDEFKDVPVDPETERIEADFYQFPAGTHREEIGHWFEDTFNVRVHDLLYE